MQQTLSILVVLVDDFDCMLLWHLVKGDTQRMGRRHLREYFLKVKILLHSCLRAIATEGEVVSLGTAALELASCLIAGDDFPTCIKGV